MLGIPESRRQSPEANVPRGIGPTSSPAISTSGPAEAWVGEGLGPAAEGLVGGDRDGVLLLAFGEGPRWDGPWPLPPVRRGGNAIPPWRPRQPRRHHRRVATSVAPPGATTRPPTGRSRERGPSVHLSSLRLSSRPLGVRIGPRHRNTSPDGPCGHRPRAHARWPVTLPQEVPLAVIAGQERGARDIGLLNGT